MENITLKKSISSVTSSFIFNDYVVNKVEFQINNSFHSDENIDLDFKLSTDFNLNEKKDQAMVTLSCVVFDGFKKENYPFFLNVEIVGSFSILGDFEDEQIINLCRVNATAILFPYLRAFISNITSLAGVPNLLLPTVNINKLLED